MDSGRETAPFAIHVEGPDGLRRLTASAIVDASGTYGVPNPGRPAASSLPSPVTPRRQPNVELVLPESVVCGGSGQFDGQPTEENGGACCTPSNDLITIGSAPQASNGCG